MQSPVISIGNKKVGGNEPILIIAEAGVNHNKDVSLGMKLIDVAKEAGADVVKFQTWKTEKLCTKNVDMVPYQKENVKGIQSQFDLIKRCELSYADFKKLKDYADKKNIMFMSTPDEEESVDYLDSIGVDAFKISSAEITCTPFLEYVAKREKPIILSTGMSDLDEVKRAVKVILSTGNNQLILLHCVSNYPADISTYNLRAMKTMSRVFGLPVGLSDHSLGFELPIAAVALGACVIEKHFTLDKNLPGPDHSTSLNGEELCMMVDAIRKTECALGKGIKKPTEAEIENRPLMRKSIVASRDIKKGQKISQDDIIYLRSNPGLYPYQRDLVIGRYATVDIPKHTTIQLEMLV